MALSMIQFQKITKYLRKLLGNRFKLVRYRTTLICGDLNVFLCGDLLCSGYVAALLILLCAL